MGLPPRRIERKKVSWSPIYQEKLHIRVYLFFLVIDAQVSPSTGRERESTERIMQFRSQSRQQLLIYCTIISLDSSLDRRKCNHFNSIRRTFEYLRRHN